MRPTDFIPCGVVFDKHKKTKKRIAKGTIKGKPKKKTTVEATS